MYVPTELAGLVAINAVVAGLEIAACVVFTFIPPLLLKAGFSETQMSIIMGVGPAVALLTVPGLGRWSDKCKSPWGRRKPFIVAFSLLLVVSLFLLYIGQAVLVLETDSDMLTTRRVSMTLLAVGVVLLDYTSQAAINPCEALVSDLMAAQGGGEAGFMVYSGMLSLGACLGYLLCALDWPALGVNIGTKEQTAIIVVLLLYLGCLGITLVTAKERPFKAKSMSLVPVHKEDESTAKLKEFVEVGAEPEEMITGGRRTRLARGRLSVRGLVFLQLRNLGQILVLVVSICLKVVSVPLFVYRTIRSAPSLLRQLFLADLVSWIAIMAHAMFYTDFVATAVYGGQPDAPPGSVHDLLFDEGVRMGSWGLLLHGVAAGLYAVFLHEHVTKIIGLKRSYQLGLGLFSLSMAATVLLSSSLTILNIAAAVSGIGFAVITTIPNTVVTMYHQDPALFYGEEAGKAGVGEDIAILDSGYYLSQIFLSLVMGSVVEMTGVPHYYMLAACLFGAAAILLAANVVFDPQDLKQQLITRGYQM